MDPRITLPAEHMATAQILTMRTPFSATKRLRDYTEWAVITGASSGIGAALTMHLSTLGYKILAIGGHNQLALERVKLLSEKDMVTIVVADLTKESELHKVAQLLKSEDRIKYLVHCAATTEPHLPLSAITSSELTKAFGLNVIAPLILTQTLMPYFTDKPRVLFLGSDYIDPSKKMQSQVTGAYALTKAAQKVAIQYLAKEEEKDKIVRIGYLNPGPTDTPMFKSVKSAVLSRQGVFNKSVQPASPRAVAEFIGLVLRNSSDSDYTTRPWDFRNPADHQKVEVAKEEPAYIHNMRSKL